MREESQSSAIVSAVAVVGLKSMCSCGCEEIHFAIDSHG